MRVKRLQVLFEEPELRELRRVARRHRMTTAAWVRQQLRAAVAAEAGTDTATKLAAVRAAVRLSYPTGDIAEVLADIERGYLEADA
jgi:hypothetical protein